MKYFNSVTGRIEDDGKELVQPGMLNIPGGRLASPDGSQDIQIPTDGMYAQDQYERKTSKQNDLAMMENPESYPFSKMFDFQNSMPMESELVQSMQSDVVKPIDRKQSQGNRKPAVMPEDKSQPLAKEMKPEVKKYIMEKFKISEDLSEQAYRDAQQAGIKNNFNLNLAEAANDIGSAIAGVKTNNQYYDKLRTQANDGEKNILSARKFEKDSRDEKLQVDKLNSGNDIGSDESNFYQKFAKQMVPGMDFSQMSANKIKELLPSVENYYNMNVKKQENQLNREMKNFAKQQISEDNYREYDTTYGQARTKDDAKKIKAGSELKQKFDRQLDELISMREDLGVEYWDRDAVGRGNQLSKDLLLTYKDMANLGVLSQADEKILNAIIPSDPLGQDMVPGQDPILHKLKSFKGDANADFESRLQNRLLKPEQSGNKPKWAK